MINSVTCFNNCSLLIIRKRSHETVVGKTLRNLLNSVTDVIQDISWKKKASTKLFGWLVVFGLNDPLRQYFSLYRVVSQREGERKEKGQMRVKMSKQPPPALTASAVGPCPTLIHTSRMPRTWKFIQDHRTTRPPPLAQNKTPPNTSLISDTQVNSHFPIQVVSG